MRRAIALAGVVRGSTGPNPSVGCVIAIGERVIAEAATAPGGRPHAEEQALVLAGPLARGATAFVTVEPCGERSDGSLSCACRLIAAGIGRVVYGLDNPDPRSAGRGPISLKQCGVTVEHGLLAGEASAEVQK